MTETTVLSKKALLILVFGLLVMNFLTFLAAYPQISNIDSGCCLNQPLAKEFSGVYIRAWRLFHDPMRVHAHGYVADGEVQIYPQPEQYKYLPSFLLMVSPVLLVKYQEATVLYDTVPVLTPSHYRNPGLQSYEREGMGYHDHCRSHHATSACRSSRLGILSRLFLAVE